MIRLPLFDSDIDSSPPRPDLESSQNQAKRRMADLTPIQRRLFGLVSDIVQTDSGFPNTSPAHPSDAGARSTNIENYLPSPGSPPIPSHYSLSEAGSEYEYDSSAPEDRDQAIQRTFRELNDDAVTPPPLDIRDEPTEQEDGNGQENGSNRVTTRSQVSRSTTQARHSEQEDETGPGNDSIQVRRPSFPQMARPTRSILVHGVREYYVEAIRDYRIESDGSARFLVKWRWYPENECTWEPATYLKQVAVFREYINRIKAVNEAT